MGLLLLSLAVALARAEPRVDVISRGAPAPGEAVLIVAAGQSRPPRGRLGDTALLFVKGRAGTYVALAAFDLDVATGPARLELDLRDADGMPHYWSSEVFVATKAFPTQELAVEDKFVRLKKADED